MHPTIVIGFVLTIVGIVVAGPWLTRAFTRLLARAPLDAASLIASRRLADNPAAAFRAVSGLILAVFVGSVFAAGAATACSPTALGDDAGAATTAIARPAGAPLTSLRSPGRPSPSTEGGLRGSRRHADARRSARFGRNGFPHGLIAAPISARHPRSADAPAAASPACRSTPSTPATANRARPWPAAPAPQRHHLASVQGSWSPPTRHAATLERVRTDIQTEAPVSHRPENPRSTQPRPCATSASSTPRRPRRAAQHYHRRLQPRRRRRREPYRTPPPLRQLRLTGMPLRSLRRVVLLEAAVPLAGLAAVSAAGGLITAELLLRALRGTTIQLPGAPYAITVLARDRARPRSCHRHHAPAQTHQRTGKRPQ